jgi:hypothetical protein
MDLRMGSLSLSHLSFQVGVLIGCTSFPGCSVLGFGPNLNPRKKDFTL